MTHSSDNKERGIALLECFAAITFFLLLLYPLIGVIDLFLTQQALEGIAHQSVNESDIVPFRLFSGSKSWYTRPIDGADEENFLETSNQELRAQTRLYHERFNQMADRAENDLRNILGRECVSDGCAQALGVELRIVVPYIQHDTKELIRITCFAQGVACPHGRAGDLEQHISRHRFLRSRGALLRGRSDFRDRIIDIARSPAILSDFAIPSGLFHAEHLQDYGAMDYQLQHGYTPSDGEDIAPNYVRHIMLLAARVAVDLDGTPAGFVLRIARRFSAATSGRATVLSSEAYGIPRSDF